MSENQKKEIERLRKSGLGYGRIAVTLNLSRDTVRNYCKSKGLNGYQFTEQAQRHNAKDGCQYCGNPLQQPKTGRRRKFCCEKCRRAWDASQIRINKHKCQYCGKEFEGRGSKQKLCSHNCYIRSWFWREEDAAEIMALLKRGEQPQNIP